MTLRRCDDEGPAVLDAVDADAATAVDDGGVTNGREPLVRVTCGREPVGDADAVAVTVAVGAADGGEPVSEVADAAAVALGVVLDDKRVERTAAVAVGRVNSLDGAAEVFCCCWVAASR